MSAEKDNKVIASPQVHTQAYPTAGESPAGDSGRSQGLSFRNRMTPFKGDQTPGPGAYECSSRHTEATASFGSRTFQKDSRESYPGPGSYDAYRRSVSMSASKYGFGTRTPIRDPTILNPPPGAYEITSPKTESGLRFRKRQTQRYENDNPSPFHYSPERKRSQGPRFSGRNGPLFRLNDNPGPGDYNVKRPISGPVVTLKSRVASLKPYDVPGPGTYNPKEIRERPKENLRHTATQVVPKPENPGPGTYDVKSPRRGTAPTFSGRPKIPDTAGKTPGPGAYDPKFSETSKPQTMKYRSRMAAKDDVPGPGTYDVRSPQRAGTAPSFSSRLPWKFETPNPGPGTYSPERKVKGGITLGSRHPAIGVAAQGYVE